MESMRKFKEITNINKDRLNRIRSKKKKCLNRLIPLNQNLNAQKTNITRLRTNF